MRQTTGPGIGFRGPQVCTVVGITYRQLDYWARTDLLRPSISEARGSGTQRLYSYSDLVELKVIKRLLDSGISLQSARRAIDCLRSSGDDVGSANLVLNEGRTVLARTGEEIVDLLKGGQGVLNIVPMAGLVSELDAAILELGLDGSGGLPALRGAGPGGATAARTRQAAGATGASVTAQAAGAKQPGPASRTRAEGG
jgi:DNA-binding transcriptional MerR regulator